MIDPGSTEELAKVIADSVFQGIKRAKRVLLFLVLGVVAVAVVVLVLAFWP